jgi:hypothetical protein
MWRLSSEDFDYDQSTDSLAGAEGNSPLVRRNFFSKVKGYVSPEK